MRFVLGCCICYLDRFDTELKVHNYTCHFEVLNLSRATHSRLWLLDNIFFFYSIWRKQWISSAVDLPIFIVPVWRWWDWVRINCVCFHCHQWNRKDDNWDLLTTRKTVKSLVSVSVLTRWVSPTVQNDLHQQTQSCHKRLWWTPHKWWLRAKAWRKKCFWKYKNIWIYLN